MAVVEERRRLSALGPSGGEARVGDLAGCEWIGGGLVVDWRWIGGGLACLGSDGRSGGLDIVDAEVGDAM